MTTIAHRPLLLLILDGWGYRPEMNANAIAQAKTPHFDNLWNHYPHTLIHCSGLQVGLPEGQMGNSEVGHLNLGAGRTVYQDLTRINNAIESDEFFKNKILIEAINSAIQINKAIHIFGLLSNGGIHSCEKHIHAIMQLAKKCGAKKLYMHAFLDGRDTPPKSAEEPITHLEKLFSTLGVGKIASLTGRYYAMDRDKRWERIEKAYNLLTLGEADYYANTAINGLQQAYARGETDEFVKPISIHSNNEKPIMVNDGDVIIFMNFRADRAREITRCFIEKDFKEFSRKRIVKPSRYIALTEYDKTFNIPVAYLPEQFKNNLGEYIASHHLKQLHITETEKYAHVTFFLNGGVETQMAGEDRHLIPSPKVATYDLKPEMSVYEVTDKLVKCIQSKQYDVIICNFANGDMLGHTGNFDATIASIEAVDQCIGKTIAAIQSVSGEAIITADHGNAELMYDPKTKQPHTAHTCNDVPFIYVGRFAKINDFHAALSDVAPTVLYLMNLPIPKEMTGKPIVTLAE